MTRSLRRTLAVRFAATMALGLVVVSAAALWGSQQVLLRQLDQGLAASAFVALDRLVNFPACCETEPALAREPALFARSVNRYIVLRDAQGGVLHALPNAAADLPFDAEAFQDARFGELVFVYGTWHGQTIRSAYRPVEGRDAGAGTVLQAAASLEPIQNVQRQLVIFLAMLVLFGAGATYIGAWQLGGSVVRPVMELTAQANQIQAGSLDQQLVAQAEDDEYRGLVNVLNGMLQRLALAFRNQRRLTADVSHELRTPLTALQGEMEVALRAVRTPAEYQRVLRSALEEIARLTAMSEDLLLITRAEARLIEPHRTPTDLADLVRQGIDGLHSRIEEKGLVVDVPANGHLRPLPLDRGLVARLVDHLLDNAIKFAPDQGTIRVATEAIDGGVRLCVENSGTGFVTADLGHVFEPFYRADAARSSDSGRGLGLALVAAIVRLHGGMVRASNPPEGGARIEVEFPGGA